MGLDNLLSEGQADSMPGNVAAVKTAEHVKYSVFILRIDSNSVIANRKNPSVLLLAHRDVDFRGDAWPAVLDRIADQILQNVLDARVSHDGH